MKKNINNGVIVAVVLVVLVLIGGAIAYSLRDPDAGNNLGMLKPGAPPMRPSMGGGGGGSNQNTSSSTGIQ
jgi:hypothetical protein